LPTAGRPGKHHVLAEGCYGQSLLAALLFDFKPGRQPFDFLLHRGKADHCVELLKCGGDRNFVVFELLTGCQDDIFDRDHRNIG